MYLKELRVDRFSRKPLAMFHRSSLMRWVSVFNPTDVKFHLAGHSSADRFVLYWNVLHASFSILFCLKWLKDRLCWSHFHLWPSRMSWTLICLEKSHISLKWAVRKRPPAGLSFQRGCCVFLCWDGDASSPLNLGSKPLHLTFVPLGKKMRVV